MSLYSLRILPYANNAMSTMAKLYFNISLETSTVVENAKQKSIFVSSDAFIS